MTLFCISIFIAFCYLSLIIYAMIGLRKNGNSKRLEHSFPFCSIVIAARNEETAIKNICRDLLSQSYPEDCYEIIIVDDHSEDGTISTIKQFRDQRICLVEAPEGVTGKKAALKYGLSQVHGEYIFFTDADCHVGSNWLETYIAQASEGILFFGCVIPQISEKSTIVEKCAALDFIGIQAIQTGLAKQNHAFSCNGANMCITRDFFVNHYDTNNNYSSGDDVFLLHKAKTLNSPNVRIIQDSSASVSTPMPQSILAFIRQRCRWASKAGGYKDRDSIAVSLIVYLTCLWLCISAIGVLFSSMIFLLCFILVFSAKMIGDLAIFIQTASYYKSKKYLWLAIPFECVYFIYVTLIPIIVVVHPVQWKNRKIE